MCCEFVSWNDGRVDCFMHMGGDLLDQVEELEEVTISAQIYQYTELEEYVEREEDI